MKKLKTLALSVGTAISMACAPLMAAPYFSINELVSWNDHISQLWFYANTGAFFCLNYDIAVERIPKQPEECAIIIASLLHGICGEDSMPIIDFSQTRDPNYELIPFTFDWLQVASKNEIGQEMVKILSDIDNFDTQYFKFSVDIRQQSFYKSICLLLTIIKIKYYDYYKIIANQNRPLITCSENWNGDVELNMEYICSEYDDLYCKLNS